MNLNLTSSEANLQLQGHQPYKPAKQWIHPDNRGELDPSNPDNPHDAFGDMHNRACNYALTVVPTPYHSKAIAAAIQDYVKANPFTDKAMKVIGRNPEGIPPYSTIFWPPIPDFLLQGGFEDIMRKTDSFDPRTDSYIEFKNQIVGFEKRFIDSMDDLKMKYAWAITGVCSLIRHSMALWIGRHYHQAQQAINTGSGDPGEIMALCNPVVKADRKAFRASMRLNVGADIAAENVAHASSMAEVGM